VTSQERPAPEGSSARDTATVPTVGSASSAAFTSDAVAEKRSDAVALPK